MLPARLAINMLPMEHETPDFERTVGLFGTCGRSRWREPVRAALDARGIPSYDPQVPEGTWHPGLVPLEHRHLEEDGLIVFAITAETTGQGSLAEVGFSLLASLRANPFRTFVLHVDPRCDADAPAESVKESIRSRALVRSRVEAEARRNPKVFVCRSMEDLPALTCDAHAADEAARKVRRRWMP